MDALKTHGRKLTSTNTQTGSGTNIRKRAQGTLVTDRVDKVLFVQSAASAELDT